MISNIEIENFKNDNHFFYDENGNKVKILGYARGKDSAGNLHVYIYFRLNDTNYIEEKLDIYKDIVTSVSNLKWIEDEKLWQILFDLGIKNNILN